MALEIAHADGVDARIQGLEASDRKIYKLDNKDAFICEDTQQLCRRQIFQPASTGLTLRCRPRLR